MLRWCPRTQFLCLGFAFWCISSVLRGLPLAGTRCHSSPSFSSPSAFTQQERIIFPSSCNWVSLMLIGQSGGCPWTSQRMWFPGCPSPDVPVLRRRSTSTPLEPLGLRGKEWISEHKPHAILALSDIDTGPARNYTFSSHSGLTVHEPVISNFWLRELSSL